MNQHDAIAAIWITVTDYESMFGRPLAHTRPVDSALVGCRRWRKAATEDGGTLPLLNFQLSITTQSEQQRSYTC